MWSGALRLLCAAVCLGGFYASPVPRSEVEVAPLEEVSVPRSEVEAAPLEEVNVIVYGVMQFSGSLRSVYDTVEAKMARIGRSLRTHEETLQRLGRVTESAAEGERRLRERLDLLQVQTAVLQTEVQVTRDKLVLVEQEEAELRTQVTRLETQLRDSSPDSITQLQSKAP